MQFNNVWFGALGGSYRMTDEVTGGLQLDAARASVDGAPQVRELSAFTTLKFGKTSKVNFYVLKGLAKGSPDWGGGLNYTYAFR